jgi:hypothetical protein
LLAGGEERGGIGSGGKFGKLGRDNALCHASDEKNEKEVRVTDVLLVSIGEALSSEKISMGEAAAD